MMIASVWVSVLTILIGFTLPATPEQIPFIPCGDKLFTSLYITPCNKTVVDDWNTCLLMHGEVVTFEAFFVAPFNSSSLQVATMLALDGVEVPSINSGYDPCYGSITPPCPVIKGKTYLFHRDYDIQGEFPTGSMNLRLIIEDMETKEVAACAKVPVVVIKNPKYLYFDN